MKNIERGTIKYLVMLIITIAICGMIMYPLFDLFLCKFITHSEFVYTAESHVFQPVIAALVAGIVIWVIDKKSK